MAQSDKLTAPIGLPRGRNRPLLAGLMLSAALAAAFECVWLETNLGIFSGGGSGVLTLSWFDGALFVFGSLLVDAAVILPVGWLVTMAVGRMRRLNGARRLFLACAIASMPVMLADFLKVRVVRNLGDTVDLMWLAHMAGNAPRTIFSTISGQFLVVAGALALLAVALVVVYRLLRNLRPAWLAEERMGVPTLRGTLGRTALLLAASAALLWAAGATRERLSETLQRTVTGAWIAAAGDFVTDVDRDGYGVFVPPRDFAPFDSRRHPYAVNVPGSGIDANGLGVVLASPGDFSDEAFEPVTFASRPDFVLIVLESFRYDNLGATAGGKPVTPFLSALAAGGAACGKGYSPSGFTTSALHYLFAGGRSLTSRTSLIDDFHANGYTVACISAQNEAFGDVETITGMTRADFFTDARANTGSRSAWFTSTGALAVPWPVLVGNVRRYLAEPKLAGKPLFLHVNIQDCHYPYDHYAMERLTEKNPLSRSQIRPGNAPGVMRTYRNAAANVDLAISQVLAEVEKVRGRKPAFVIVGDHGESLYDPELLGHGIEMLDEQHAIPVLVGNFAADCVFPMGLGELRGVIRAGLCRPPGAPSVRTDPEKGVFLHIGDPDRPFVIGMGGESGILRLRLKTREWSTLGRPPESFTREDVVRTWEQIVYRRTQAAAR